MRNLYFSRRFYSFFAGTAMLFGLGYVIAGIYPIARSVFFVGVGILLTDLILLFRMAKGIHAVRFAPDRLSNGDQNEIRIYAENNYPIKLRLQILDEIPVQFQKRDAVFKMDIDAGTNRVVTYHLRPVRRGLYHFGYVQVFAETILGFARRRYRFGTPVEIPVYPSYIDLRRYELMAISNRLSELGVKKIRRLGHAMEFEQIKEYVPGDDVRTINWKATARQGHLMVNNYQDERSQQVYCLIDKGRSMRMPFDGMTLLDYSINAALMISNVALKKDDKAGIITFQHKIGSVLPAGKRARQMELIQQTLFNQKTAYKESDYSRLFTFCKRKITHRSLLLLFSNFETVSGLQRQMPYLRKLAANHVLVVIFFQNTSLLELVEQPASKLREVYHKAIAQKYLMEKAMVKKILKNAGVYAIMTTPKNLNIDTINYYLELKSRGII